jgi:hypothetical protein
MEDTNHEMMMIWEEFIIYPYVLYTHARLDVRIVARGTKGKVTTIWRIQIMR